MAKGVRIQLNHPGIEELLRSDGVEAELMARARRVEAAAEQSAPVESGEYRQAIRSFSEDHKDRVVAHVWVEVPYATRVEAKHGTLARALDAAGG